uniref:NADH-ubiquinone oxidoreductase chain 4L n=1 Tax=Asyndetus clavipes TaxID=2779313 RepID=A0A7U3RRL5_9MUSC|nr:NADH dehydrogenase subunit 4L [Asyndetus clavipes]QOL12446.1 NADH dehydrogenase subunit 4L [Asyndetus clavipes]
MKLLKLMLTYIIFMFMFFSGLIVFVLNRKHLLSMLLSLEYIVLSLFCLLFFYLSIVDYQSFFSMMFLTFSVCEGALGLSILVSLIRTHGNDYFQSFNILQC